MPNIKAKIKFNEDFERTKASLNKELLEQYLKTHSYKETLVDLSNKYNCSQAIIRKLIQFFGAKGKPIGYALSTENQESKKQAMINKYGVDNPQKNKEIRERTKQTNFNKYGVYYPAQNKEVIEKQKQTNLEKYGCENVFQATEIKEAIKETLLEKYGVEHVSFSKEIVAKRADTKLARYGDPGYNNYEQIKNTNLARYGVKNLMHNYEIKAKVKQTNLKKYGVENVMQNEEIYKKHWKKYHFDNMCFDSSWEIAFYIYYRDHNIIIDRESVILDYEFNNKKHKYYVDFKVNNQLYEVKSNYLLKKMAVPNSIDNAKYNCLINNNVIIIDNSSIKPYLEYINNNYGKDFLKSFKRNKKDFKN